MLRLALAALLLAPAALAQSDAEDAPAASATLQAAVDRASAAAPPRAAPALIGALRAAQVRSVVELGRTGASVTLPIGWDGPVHVDDEHRNRMAVTLTNAAPGHPLAGATIRVERVVGFEGIERQRWLRGQSPYRYHRAGPVGPTTLPGYDYAVELGGDGVGGAVVFVPQGPSIWAITVEAPAGLWAAKRAAVAGLVRGVRLP